MEGRETIKGVLSLQKKPKPMRNPNGFGTVYKLPGRRRRPWVARVTTGWTTVVRKRGKNKGKEMPKQLYQTIGYFETSQEALDALVLHRISPVSPKAGMTLAEVYEEWSVAKYKNISKATENNYRAAWKYMDKLKGAKVKDIRTTHWQGIIDDCKDAGLSKSTLEKIRTLAVMLSGHAMKNDIINKNYASLVDMPKFEKAKKERFTDPEVKKIEKAAEKKIPWVDTVLIMIYTGMRISEMLGLTRFNVDLKNKLITGGIKTDAGKNRVIPIHSKIISHVQRWYDREGETLICDEKGKPLPAKRYREKMYYPALEAAGVRRLTPHACRHTFGSLMAEAGVEPIYIQKLIGHTDYAFTANEYTHPEIAALRKAIEQI